MSKKTTAPAASKRHLRQVKNTPVVNPDPPLVRVTREEYLALENSHLKVENGLAKIQQLQNERASYLRQIDPENKLGMMDQSIVEQAKTVNENNFAGRQIAEAIEARLGIRLNSCTIDDKTLVVHFHETGPASHPDSES